MMPRQSRITERLLNGPLHLGVKACLQNYAWPVFPQIAFAAGWFTAQVYGSGDSAGAVAPQDSTES
jgi:hypothetical protein